MYLFLSFILFLNTVWAKQQIDIACYSPYLFPSEENPLKWDRLQEEFDLRFIYNGYIYANNFPGNHPNLKKIIFLDSCTDPKMKKLPKHKTVCFIWEPTQLHTFYYDCFSRVYTFDDDLVDDIKFFKFYYPVLQPMMSPLPSFDEKKLCAMIVCNWLPERIKMVDFFATKPKGSLDLYGNAPRQYYRHEMDKGRIGGGYSSPEKLNTLKNYRFCIYFENTHTIPGYVTEKLFDAFAAGCVPIYWGPENIEDYIPTDCFIDYRNFNNNEEMYQFITSMTEFEYMQYLDRIQQFLQSEQAQLFSQEHFFELVYEAILSG
ncbi:MAG: hypothetical protein K1000chlam2_00654 [Chlamydiae bacterium]|nr:hypothetical protein [Chlamydiota bacterium]